MNPIKFSLNGKAVEATCRADMTVLEWLRGEALLRGTKEGCAEGDCGACSVLMKRPSIAKSRETHLPTNSCILLMGQIEGASLMTVEGLSEVGDDGHSVQNEMAINGSSQCGFCTPGIVVSLAGLLDQNKKPQEHEIHDALAGNLCRCTGYRPIVEAAQKAAKKIAKSHGKEKLPTPKSKPLSQDVGLKESKFLKPDNLTDLLKLRRKFPNAILLAGGTDLALDVSHAKVRWPLALVTSNVPQLREIKKTRTHLEIGAAATWQELLPYIKKSWPSFATLIRRFGSVQIRSMGTIGGNLGTASPIGDSAPALLALGAELALATSRKTRRVQLSEFFTGYRKTVLKPDEIIQTIHLPLPKRGQEFRVYKISKRYDQDISTVCGAFFLEKKGDEISQARVAYGGMSATSQRCIEAEKLIEKDGLSDIDAVSAAIQKAFKPMSDMRGTAEYRSRVAANLIHRFANDLDGDIVEVMAL